jgi:diguanylate cyclase (GGDEF)-like protein
MEHFRVAIIDDSPDDCAVLQRILSRSSQPSFSVSVYPTLASGKQALRNNHHDLYLVDLGLPDGSGFDLLKFAENESIDKPLVIMTGTGEGDIDGQAMSLGATDFLHKNEIERDQLIRRLRYAIQRKHYEMSLKHHANHDRLTGLAQAHYFREETERAVTRHLRSGSHLALLLLDLDGFKQVNDNFGHSTGDQMLQHVSKVLRNLVRGGDLVGRLGGDEFGILLENVNDFSAPENLSRKLQARISRPLNNAKGELRVGVSVGIAQCPVDGSSGIKLFECADMRMYEQKHQRKQRRLSSI